MSSGPEGEQLPSPRGRIDDGICSDACVIQDPLTLQAGPYMTMPSVQSLHGPVWSTPLIFVRLCGYPPAATGAGALAACCRRATSASRSAT